MSERLSELIDQTLEALALLRRELVQAASALRQRGTTPGQKPRRVGKKPLAKGEQARRKAVLEAWRQTHKATEADGLIHKTRKEFCEDWSSRHGARLTVRHLEKYQNWERMRKKRKA